jgi:hypothetical protein
MQLVVDNDKHTSLLYHGTHNLGKMLLLQASGGQFHKRYMGATYGPSKLSLTVYFMHAHMQHFQNALAYFATAMRIRCL